MTQKDYIIIADAIQRSIKYFDDSEADNHIFWVAANLSAALQQDNPRFNRTKFLRACGMEV